MAARDIEGARIGLVEMHVSESGRAEIIIVPVYERRGEGNEVKEVRLMADLPFFAQDYLRAMAVLYREPLPLPETKPDCDV